MMLRNLAGSFLLFTMSASMVEAQGTRADYERANGLRARFENLATGLPEPATFIEDTSDFWYRRFVKGGYEFVTMNAQTQAKRPAFDHERLAGSLAKAMGSKQAALALPTQGFKLTDKGGAVELVAAEARWRCDLSEYTCKKLADVPAGFVQIPFACSPQGPDDKPVTSPDGQREAFVLNSNLAVRDTGPLGSKPVALSTDGSEGNCYQRASIKWSPDSTKIAAYRIRPGYRRMVHYVQSSPEDQVQPKASSRFYAKPGDVLDLKQPVLFEVATRAQRSIDNSLFPNPYDLQPMAWRKDSRAFTFEYNQRGHQVYRIIDVDAATAAARAVVSEEPKTFFHYNLADGSLTGSGKRFRHDVDDGAEVIWMSERDGWNHLYLFDGRTSALKNQITKGPWVVRGVNRVDEAKRQIWFSAGGRNPGDPYFLDYYRINFDGTGLTRLTSGDSNHQATFSSDMKVFVDTHSRVDQAPVSELRRADDGSLITVIEGSDTTALKSAGWSAPDVFLAKGRDGATDIVGVIFKPSNFDPRKKYPVIESIYAGPHGSFVPKSFAVYSALRAQAEMGFIVVQIDGMGTSNRSKAFHDIAWQNLGDAGFPDRILWHKAVAAKYPWYDITRVGIYGGSAGGQNSFGALLFHPEFYKAAVSYAGCHDNRMDKIWWNEQWMGWPIGPQYAASSNVDNAWRLKGKVLFVVGEMDSNVDPSSTMQVGNALIKANKKFDLLVVPGAEHNAGRGGESGPYGERLRFDFFVQNLLGVMPPNWNEDATKPSRE